MKKTLNDHSLAELETMLNSIKQSRYAIKNVVSSIEKQPRLEAYALELSTYKEILQRYEKLEKKIKVSVEETLSFNIEIEPK